MMKPNEKEELSEEPLHLSKQLTVAHLNNDCLEKVFSYLSPTDLTNVAESIVHSAISARNCSGHQYKTTEFKYTASDVKSMKEDTFELLMKRVGKYRYY